MLRTVLGQRARFAVGVALLCCLPIAAQTPVVETSATLIPVSNTNPALVTDRHLAARAAGYRALHHCTGSSRPIFSNFGIAKFSADVLHVLND